MKSSILSATKRIVLDAPGCVFDQGYGNAANQPAFSAARRYAFGLTDHCENPPNKEEECDRAQDQKPYLFKFIPN